MALRGVHEGVLAVLERNYPDKKEIKVLDVGAGQGALTKRIFDAGYDVSACEMNPDDYVFDQVECRAADVSKSLPFSDDSFDVIVAAEIIEHLLDQQILFEECARILKPNGKLILSTPNILSMKSRLQFFSSGYYWSFDPLDMQDRGGLHKGVRRIAQRGQVSHCTHISCMQVFSWPDL